MLKIDESRFWADFEELAQIGATGDGGVSRPALSPVEIEARDWFKNRAESDGFTVQMNGAGNLSARLNSTNPMARTLLMGSHLDSVVNGGRFDGALGVLSALATLRAVRDAKLALPFHLEAISFTDEEGSLFGLLGSSAVAGLLTREMLQTPRGGRDTLLAGMARVGINEDTLLAAKRDSASLLGYLEVHIEQGTRLEEAKLNIGVVTAIVGIYSFRLRFLGEAAHAGTMPMEKRRDALWGAAAFIQRARELVKAQFSPGVVNVGSISAQPGAFNIVPGVVEVALEFRHGTSKQLNEMEMALLGIAQDAANDFGLELEIQSIGKHAPAQMDENLMQTIEKSSAMLGLSHTRLMSFAGHDPQSIAHIAPVAMFFVPSVKGISHNPREFTQPEDCINGANVLLNAVLAYADQNGT